jgi:hypothetical protein
MNNEHRPADFERLEPPLEAAVDAVLDQPLPQDAVERVKARARQLAEASPATRLPKHPIPQCGRRGSRVVVSSLAVVAVLIVMTTSAVWLLDQSAARTFAQAIEKVNAARSVQFATATRLGRRPEITGRMYLAGDRIRLEQFDGMLVQVADPEQKEALFLDRHRKLAQPTEMDQDVARAFANPIDQLRRARSQDAEPIGQEILRGRRTQVYRLPQVDLLGIKGDFEMLVWVDVESELPAKIVIRDADPKFETEFRFDEFVWNEPLDDRLFSLNIPDGFETGIVLTTPDRTESKDHAPAAPDAAPAFADGILSRDRVPGHILWTPPGTTITALMRDPESIPAQNRRIGELRQWDVATGELRWSETAAILGLAGTADGTLLATVVGYELQLRDAASGRITRKWAADKRLSPLAFSPDGKMLAAGIAEWGPYGGQGAKVSGGVQFWDVEQAGLIREISDDKPVTFVRYSVDGKYLASSSNEGPIKLWDVATGELVRIFPGRSRADFSPDGQAIAFPSATSAADKTVGRVDLYHLRDGSFIRSFSSKPGASASWLLSVAFSPDGRLLAAADWNGTVTLWDVATGERQRTITDHQGGVHAAIFSPDGTTLATGSEDKSLRLWKLPIE